LDCFYLAEELHNGTFRFSTTSLADVDTAGFQPRDGPTRVRALTRMRETSKYLALVIRGKETIGVVTPSDVLSKPFPAPEMNA
jgi:hypothetical protein